MTTFYGLGGLDEKVIPYIGTEPGFFFEAGANDGTTQSNTRVFEESFGWSGILVEPILPRFAQCSLNRRKSFVEWGALTSATDPRTTLTLAYCDLMTVTRDDTQSVGWQEHHLQLGRQFLQNGDTVHEFEAPALTISGLLDKHRSPPVDFMSIDLEGYEEHALRGLDLSRHRPKAILVELRSGVAEAVEAYLGDYYASPIVIVNHGHHWDSLFLRR